MTSPAERLNRLIDRLRDRLLAFRLRNALRRWQASRVLGMRRDDDWGFAYLARDARAKYPRLPEPGRIDPERYGAILYDAADRACR